MTVCGKQDVIIDTGNGIGLCTDDVIGALHRRIDFHIHPKKPPYPQNPEFAFCPKYEDGSDNPYYIAGTHFIPDVITKPGKPPVPQKQTCPFHIAADKLFYMLRAQIEIMERAGFKEAKDFVGTDVQRVHDAAVTLLDNLAVAKTYDQKKQAIQTFEDSVKQSPSAWKVFGAVVVGVIVTGLLVAAGVAAGFGIGLLVGLWSGPGAFFSALAGASIGGSATAAASAAICSIVIPTIAGVTVGAATSFFLRPKKSDTLQWADEFITEVKAFYAKQQPGDDLQFDPNAPVNFNSTPTGTGLGPS